MTKAEEFAHCKQSIITVLTEEENVPHTKQDHVEFFDEEFSNNMVSRAINSLAEEEVLLHENGEPDGAGRPPLVYFLSPEHYDDGEEEEDEEVEAAGEEAEEVEEDNIVEETLVADATTAPAASTMGELSVLYETMTRLGLQSVTVDGDELRLKVK